MPKRTRDQPAADKPSETVEEAEKTDVSVEFLSHVYVIPRDRDDWPWIAHELFAEGKYAEGVRALIGDTQWDRLYRNGALTRREYRDFANMLADAAARECVGI